MFEKLLCKLGKHKWSDVGQGWVSLSEDVQTEHYGRICKCCRILEGTTDKFEASEDVKRIVKLNNKLYKVSEELRQEKAKRPTELADGRILIQIHGQVGVGKSAVAALIEGRLKDLGLTVDWACEALDRQLYTERNDIAVAVASVNPVVTIVEMNAAKPGA